MPPFASLIRMKWNEIMLVNEIRKIERKLLTNFDYWYASKIYWWCMFPPLCIDFHGATDVRKDNWCKEFIKIR